MNTDAQFCVDTALDIELKKLLWIALIRLTNHNIHAVYIALAESPFIGVLMQYLNLVPSYAPNSPLQASAGFGMSIQSSDVISSDGDNYSVNERPNQDLTQEYLACLPANTIIEFQVLALPMLVQVRQFCVPMKPLSSYHSG